MEPQDLPGSWGTPMVPLPCSWTPARPPHHRPKGVWVLPPLSERRRLSQVDHFRGSITRLWHWLSTLRSAELPRHRQDSLLAASQALPDGLDDPQGSFQKFQLSSIHSILLCQIYPGAVRPGHPWVVFPFVYKCYVTGIGNEGILCLILGVKPRQSINVKKWLLEKVSQLRCRSQF